jgi:hypothetical protein
MDAEINNIIYMELYSGPKMAHGKYEKTNVARSIDRDSTVYTHNHTYAHMGLEVIINTVKEEISSFKRDKLVVVCCVEVQVIQGKIK